MLQHNHTRQVCLHGPYIWHRSTHIEGIGSTFQRFHRKHSIIMAHAIDAQWIGTLEHEHHKGKDYSSFFGLNADDCTEPYLKSLKSAADNKKSIAKSTMKFIAATTLLLIAEFSLHNMCNGAISTQEYRSRFNIDENTVIEFDGKQKLVNEDWNYCTYQPRFREKFYKLRMAAFAPKRNETEIWISTHFRWGDEPRPDPEKPDFRNAFGLTRLAHKTTQIVKRYPSARVMFHSEGEMAVFQRFKDIVPTAEMHIADNWQTGIDLMSQSNILIGGTSSYFTLSAHLCKTCTVITDIYNMKFSVDSSEKRFATHHTMENIFLPS
jgi:hypothetical protein